LVPEQELELVDPVVGKADAQGLVEHAAVQGEAAPAARRFVQVLPGHLHELPLATPTEQVVVEVPQVGQRRVGRGPVAVQVGEQRGQPVVRSDLLAVVQHGLEHRERVAVEDGGALDAGLPVDQVDPEAVQEQLRVFASAHPLHDVSVEDHPELPEQGHEGPHVVGTRLTEEMGFEEIEELLVGDPRQVGTPPVVQPDAERVLEEEREGQDAAVLVALSVSTSSADDATGTSASGAARMVARSRSLCTSVRTAPKRSSSTPTSARAGADPPLAGNRSRTFKLETERRARSAQVSMAELASQSWACRWRSGDGREGEQARLEDVVVPKLLPAAVDHLVELVEVRVGRHAGEDQLHALQEPT
jgi:hypothetical protein